MFTVDYSVCAYYLLTGKIRELKNEMLRYNKTLDFSRV